MPSNVQADVLGMFQQTQEGLDSVTSSGVLPKPLGWDGVNECDVYVVAIEAEVVDDMEFYSPVEGKRLGTGLPGIRLQFTYVPTEDALANHPSLENEFKGARFMMPGCEWETFKSTVEGPFAGIGKNSGKPYNSAMIDAEGGIRTFKSAAQSILGIPMSEVSTSSLEDIINILSDENAATPVTIKIVKDGSQGKYSREYMTPTETTDAL